MGPFGPQAFASHGSSVQLKNARADSVWPVSHHQPASDAAYNRERHMGQLTAFVKGGTVTFPLGGGQSQPPQGK